VTISGRRALRIPTYTATVEVGHVTTWLTETAAAILAVDAQVGAVPRRRNRRVHQRARKTDALGCTNPAVLPLLPSMALVPVNPIANP
jgi:hypothetical protein